MVTIARLTEQDWSAARAVRLRALANDPSAFGSTYEREQAFGQDDWRARLRSGGWFAAFDHDASNDAHASDDAGAPVGLATIRALDGANADFEVNSMWVRPELRGQRIGEALLTACLADARARGARAVRLWVTVGNDAATQLYLRHGFVATGRTQPLTSGSPLTVAEYLRATHEAPA